MLQDPVKDDSGHAAVERYIADLSFNSWAIFRPQYMIGSGNNKDCEEWFFDSMPQLPSHSWFCLILSYFAQLEVLFASRFGLYLDY